MRLSNLQEFILRNRRKAIIVVVLLALLSVGLTGYQQLVAPPPVPEEEKLPPFALGGETATIAGEASFTSLSTVDFPEKITVYQAESLVFSFTEDEAKELAVRFGFQGEPRESTLPGGEGKRLTFVNTKTGGTLMVTTKPRMLTYVVEGEDGEGTLYDRSTAIARAKEFMEAKGLSVSQLSPFEVRYLTSDGSIYTEVEEPAEAGFLELSFVWSVEGRDLLGEGPTDTAAKATFDRQGKVVSLEFRYLDLQFIRFGEVKLLSFSKSIAQLKGKGLVVSTQPIGSTTGWTSIADLQSFVPTDVRLVFVRPTEAALLYPVCLFEGKGRTTAGTEVKAAVYLLAVSPEYLKTED